MFDSIYSSTVTAAQFFLMGGIALVSGFIYAWIMSWRVRSQPRPAIGTDLFSVDLDASFTYCIHFRFLLSGGARSPLGNGLLFCLSTSLPQKQARIPNGPKIFFRFRSKGARGERPSNFFSSRFGIRRRFWGSKDRREVTQMNGICCRTRDGPGKWQARMKQ